MNLIDDKMSGNERIHISEWVFNILKEEANYKVLELPTAVM